jgi:hypothetical protein
MVDSSGSVAIVVVVMTSPCGCGGRPDCSRDGNELRQ